MCIPQKAEGELRSSEDTLRQQKTASQQDLLIISATGQLWAGSSVLAVADDYRDTSLCIIII